MAGRCNKFIAGLRGRRSPKNYFNHVKIKFKSANPFFRIYIIQMHLAKKTADLSLRKEKLLKRILMKKKMIFGVVAVFEK